MINKKLLLSMALSSLLMADELDFEISGGKGTKTAQIIDGRKVFNYKKNLQEIDRLYELTVQNAYHLPNTLKLIRQGKEIYKTKGNKKELKFAFYKSDLKAGDKIQLFTSEKFKIIDIEIVDKGELEFEVANREPAATEMPRRDAASDVSKKVVPMLKNSDANKSNTSNLVNEFEIPVRKMTPAVRF